MQAQADNDDLQFDQEVSQIDERSVNRSHQLEVSQSQNIISFDLSDLNEKQHPSESADLEGPLDDLTLRRTAKSSMPLTLRSINGLECKFKMQLDNEFGD